MGDHQTGGGQRLTSPSADSIAAIATAPGAAGIGIVRLSGRAARTFQQPLVGRTLEPNQARYLPVLDEAGEPLDHAVVLFFAAPHSYTGEDVLELQGHGGPVVMQLLLDRVLALGARMARPGEFTERAFLNSKLDLAQAEAVSDLINASTESAARAASRSLEGAFSQRVQSLLSELTALRVFVEGAIDFPTDEIDFLGETALGEKVDRLVSLLDELLRGARHGAALRDGLTLAIVGPPNAGKSSLLNALSGRDSAIVTEIPGTTRDVLREQIQLDGVPLHLVDTAGLRESEDRVEQEGMRRAVQAVETADHVLVMVDDADPDSTRPKLPPAARAQTVVYNKIDRSGANPGKGAEGLYISLRTGAGLGELRAHLRRLAGASSEQEGQFSARGRHLRALETVGDHLAQAQALVQDDPQPELLAEELRLAQQALADITGEFVPDDLLGEIFSSFCIGK
ncbi:MAG: tRNA uridine-5-carboxymethylaminomethyl(34) synthesis GTPase MnmE [Pseudomonadota bacterium]